MILSYNTSTCGARIIFHESFNLFLVLSPSLRHPKSNFPHQFPIRSRSLALSLEISLGCDGDSKHCCPVCADAGCCELAAAFVCFHSSVNTWHNEEFLRLCSHAAVYYHCCRCVCGVMAWAVPSPFFLAPPRDATPRKNGNELVFDPVPPRTFFPSALFLFITLWHCNGEFSSAFTSRLFDLERILRCRVENVANFQKDFDQTKSI